MTDSGGVPSRRWKYASGGRCRAGLAPAAENGTFSDFQEGNHSRLCLRIFCYGSSPHGTSLPIYNL